MPVSSFFWSLFLLVLCHCFSCVFSWKKEPVNIDIDGGSPTNDPSLPTPVQVLHQLDVVIQTPGQKLWSRWDGLFYQVWCRHQCSFRTCWGSPAPCGCPRELWRLLQGGLSSFYNMFIFKKNVFVSFTRFEPYCCPPNHVQLLWKNLNESFCQRGDWKMSKRN